MTTPRRKACVECRQQKIRCDVEQHKVPHDPCSRCKKMGIECRILPTSTRNLRQTKAEMRRELEELKWGLRQHGADPNFMHANPPSIISAEGLSPMAGSATFSNASARTDASMSMSPSYPVVSRPVTRSGSQIPNTPTLPRILEDYIVDSKKIDDTFTLFFNQYHPMRPILDMSLSPNDYYDLSPFLFWSIVVTGGRRYSEDPTILDRVSQLITPLAFSSMALRSTPIPVIQGLLILCTWRLPTNSMFKDITHVLCGAAIHLATQIGLHISGVGQDFARTPLKKDQEHKVMRARLWMHCVIVYIRCSVAEGIPPLVIAEPILDGDEREREDLEVHIPIELRFLYRMHMILLKAMSAMAKMDMKSQNCDIGALRSLISIFDSQLLSLCPSAQSDLDMFQLNCARIHVLAFHFFANSSAPSDVEALSRLYSLCCATAQLADQLCQTTNLLVTSPSFLDRTVTLTGFIILKLLRSPHAHHFDVTAGEIAYSQAVQFTKNSSLQNNDLGARAAAIMTNLWSSHKIFRRKDGRIDSLGLRLRTRLSMSVSFDMFWYWREEFGNMLNPYNAEEHEGDETTSMPSTTQTQPETPQFDRKPLIDPATGAPALGPLTKIPDYSSPAGLGIEPSWDGYDQNLPPNPINDQFLDYDWAASFDFSNDWPNINMQNPNMPQDPSLQQNPNMPQNPNLQQTPNVQTPNIQQNQNLQQNPNMQSSNLQNSTLLNPTSMPLVETTPVGPTNFG